MMAEHIFLPSWTWQATSHKQAIKYSFLKKNFFYSCADVTGSMGSADLAQMTEMSFYNYTDFADMSD